MAKTKSQIPRLENLNPVSTKNKSYNDSYFYLPDSLINQTVEQVESSSILHPAVKTNVRRKHKPLNLLSIFLVLLVVFGVAALFTTPRSNQEAKAELLQVETTSSKSSIRQVEQSQNSKLPPMLINLELIQ